MISMFWVIRAHLLWRLTLHPCYCSKRSRRTNCSGSVWVTRPANACWQELRDRVHGTEIFQPYNDWYQHVTDHILQLISKTPQLSYDVSCIPCNKIRNRFANIFPCEWPGGNTCTKIASPIFTTQIPRLFGSANMHGCCRAHTTVRGIATGIHQLSNPI